MAVKAERSEVHTKTTVGQYYLIRLAQVRSVIWHSNQPFFFKIASVRDQKFIAYDRFRRNVEYGPTKNQSERSDLPRKTTFPHGKYQ